tara:strand:+ start:3234 stop:3452 length:219 start_codon:yes stop_codon:yes gene_type:complete
MPETKNGQPKSRALSNDPPCKKTNREQKKQLKCYKLFRKITSGNMMVDDTTIALISKCDLGDYEYVMGKNIG